MVTSQKQDFTLELGLSHSSGIGRRTGLPPALTLRFEKQICWSGGMADAMDSKSIDRKVMRVRLPPPAPVETSGR